MRTPSRELLLSIEPMFAACLPSLLTKYQHTSVARLHFGHNGHQHLLMLRNNKPLLIIMLLLKILKHSVYIATPHLFELHLQTVTSTYSIFKYLNNKLCNEMNSSNNNTSFRLGKKCRNLRSFCLFRNDWWLFFYFCFLFRFSISNDFFPRQITHNCFQSITHR